MSQSPALSQFLFVEAAFQVSHCVRIGETGQGEDSLLPYSRQQSLSWDWGAGRGRTQGEAGDTKCFTSEREERVGIAPAT